MTADAILAATISSVLPTLMVFFGIMTNKSDISQVRTSISELSGEMNGIRGEVSSVRSELISMRTQFHADIMMLVNTTNDPDKRVGRLEDKS